VREEPGEIVPVSLDADLASGRLGRPFGRDVLAFPTTVAEHEGRLLVVNSQFDRGDAPELPFTVTGLPAEKAGVGD